MEIVGVKVEENKLTEVEIFGGNHVSTFVPKDIVEHDREILDNLIEQAAYREGYKQGRNEWIANFRDCLIQIIEDSGMLSIESIKQKAERLMDK